MNTPSSSATFQPLDSSCWNISKPIFSSRFAELVATTLPHCIAAVYVARWDDKVAGFTGRAPQNRGDSNCFAKERSSLFEFTWSMCVWKCHCCMWEACLRHCTCSTAWRRCPKLHHDAFHDPFSDFRSERIKDHKTCAVCWFVVSSAWLAR